MEPLAEGLLQLFARPVAHLRAGLPVAVNDKHHREQPNDDDVGWTSARVCRAGLV
jgi:hypothetical protein